MKIRTGTALLTVLVATKMAVFAQGADTYKAKCQMCRGATGLADSPAGKSMKVKMKVKPITDPDGEESHPWRRRLRQQRTVWARCSRSKIN